GARRLPAVADRARHIGRGRVGRPSVRDPRALRATADRSRLPGVSAVSASVRPRERRLWLASAWYGARCRARRGRSLAGTGWLVGGRGPEAGVAVGWAGAARRAGTRARLEPRTAVARRTDGRIGCKHTRRLPPRPSSPPRVVCGRAPPGDARSGRSHGNGGPPGRDRARTRAAIGHARGRDAASTLALCRRPGWGQSLSRTRQPQRDHPRRWRIA